MTLGGREKARAYLVNYLSTVIILYMIITYSWLQNIFRIKTSFNLHKSPAMWVFLPFSFYILRKLRFRLVKELSLGYTASYSWGPDEATSPALESCTGTHWSTLSLCDLSVWVSKWTLALLSPRTLMIVLHSLGSISHRIIFCLSKDINYLMTKWYDMGIVTFNVSWASFSYLICF